MIVDKINKYLFENELILNEGLRYEIEKMAGVSFRRQFMETSEDTSKGKLRLSGAGKCARQLAYGYHGFEKKGKEVDSRARIIFFQGDLTELMIVSLAKLAGCNLIATGLNQTTVKFCVDGFEIEGHPDGLLLEPKEIVLAEFKSMSSYSFDKFLDGVIDYGYKAQVNVYMDSLNLNKCCIVGLNKDNGVLHEIIVDKQPEIVDECKENLLSVIKSTPENLPKQKYAIDDKGFYPWQCLYCNFWGHCRPTAVKTLIKNSYKLTEGKCTVATK